jgi:hypothetical protein
LPSYVTLTAGGVVEGAVVDASNGAGVPDATVSIDGTAISTTTDQAGTFILSQVPGSYTLTAAKPGWADTTTQPFAIAFGQATNVGLTQLGQQSGTLSGTVLSAADGSPVQGAQVCVSGTSVSTTTGPSGAFELVHLTGAWSLAVAKAGFATATAGPFTVAADQTTMVGAITLAQPSGSLAGTIVDLDGGAPVVGALVTVEGTAITTTSDATGGFTLSLAPGFYTLSASKNLGKATSPILLVSAGQTTQSGPLSLTPHEGMVTGVAVDESTGSGIPGVAVTLLRPPYDVTLTTTSDANGHFTLVAEPGSWGLKLSRLGWSAALTSTISAGETSDLGNIAMQSTDTHICGKLINSHDVPVSGASISAPPWAPTLSQLDGTFVARTYPGSIPLTITKAGYNPLTSSPIAVSAGFVADAGVLTFTEYGSVQGRVVGTTGEGVEGGTVTVDGTSIVTGTLSQPCWPVGSCEGQYLVSAPPGTYTLTFSRNGYISATTEPIAFTDGVAQTRNVSLEPAPGYDLVSLAVTPTVVNPGEEATGTVTINGPAPALEFPPGFPLDTQVYLESSNPAVTVPASVVIPTGETNATFPITTSTGASGSGATITGTYMYTTRHKSATLSFAQPSLTGVAPGWVLPGASNVVAYGRNFDPGITAQLAGPVYTLTDFQNALCDLGGGQCPSRPTAGTPNAEGTALVLTVPADLGPGLYYLTATSAGGISSSNGKWLAVDEPAKTVPVVPPEQHKYAQPIHSGQTVTGTFAAGGDTSGQYADVNAYYFVATAGSTVDVSLERVDTSKPWEHPDSLDPQIEIFASDGFLPQNLVAWDNQPAVDLNASLHDAVLPLSGIYVLYAATTRGFGEYRLHFTITSMAPPSEGARLVPLLDSFATVPVGETTTPTAIMLDPRGYRISGAQVSFAATAQADDHGTVEFTGGSTVLTNPDGSVLTTVTATAIGKVSFAPAFVDSFATSLEPAGSPEGVEHVGAGLAPARGVRPIPRYQSVARRPFAVTALYGDGSVALSTGRYERLPIERRHARKDVSHAARPNAGSGGGSLAPGERVGVRAQAVSSAPRANLLADRENEPLDASTAVPLSEPPREMIARAQGITSCGQTTFVHGIVPTGTELHPPFTATLTDLTADPDHEVGTEGIHGYRIQKTARLKLEVKDATGVEPAYPVLVQLALGGPHHGTLILDPDGNQVACVRAAFVWHERDGQGTLIAPNEEFEYRMGTYAAYVGVAPDLNHPDQVVPVWGTAETLNLSAQAKALVNGQPADPLLLAYAVHPEPGKPDHFASFDLQGQPEDNRFEYWADYLVNPVGGGITAADLRTIANIYTLADPFGNTTYGYGVTSSTSSRPNVTVEFENQLADGPDFAAYTMATSWTTDAGEMPNGEVDASLSVAYPGDPDWGGGGSVTQPIKLVFQRGTFHAVIFYPNYDHHVLFGGGTYGPWDEPVPLSVGPGNSEGVLPETTAGDTPRLALLLVTGTNIPNPMGAPWPDPHNLNWSCGGGTCTHEVGTGYDPRLEVTDPGEFRFSLMDGTGNVAKDAQFRVHLCPRHDHEGPVPPVEGYSRTCTMVPQESKNGVIESVIPNPQGSGDGRGYMGIELTRAPINPGSYWIKVESKTKTYRIREQSQVLTDDTPDGIYSGGWWLCTVMGGDILDENFQRIDPIPVITQPTLAYVRFLVSSVQPEQLNAGVTYSENGLIVSSTTAQLNRVGNSNPAVYLGRLYLTPAFPPEGARMRARALNTADTPIPVTEGAVSASVPGVAEAHGNVRASGIEVAINGTASMLDDIVVLHPAEGTPAETSVIIDNHGPDADIAFAVEPQGTATVAPSLVTLVRGASTTVRLTAVQRSQKRNDRKLVASISGDRAASAAFTNIDAEITLADIRQDKISFTLYPDDPSLFQDLTLDLVRQNGSKHTVIDSRWTGAGFKNENFMVPNLPASRPGDANGEFVAARVRWGKTPTFAEAIRPHHFENLGVWEQTAYNTPIEADSTCSSSLEEICLSDPLCQFSVVQVRSVFATQAAMNGTGRSSSYGLIHEGKRTNCAVVPPQCAGKKLFYTLPDGFLVACAGMGYLLSGSTVASGQNTKLATQENCGVHVLLYGLAEKTVIDDCPKCADHGHLDNYTTDPRCIGVPSPIWRYTIKLFPEGQ